MHFPGICLFEQTEQKFRRFESVYLKRRKTSDCNIRIPLVIKAPTKTESLNCSSLKLYIFRMKFCLKSFTFL